MRRLHPLVLVTRALQYAVTGAGVPIFLLGMSSIAFGNRVIETVPFLPLMGVGLLLGLGYGVLSYLMFTYEVTADTFDLHSGVFARREREIPHGRVQNVDATRNVWQKALGVAEVRIETAGGGSTEAELDFVSNAEAERLERELRDRRAAAQRDRRPGESADAEDVETTLLFRLSPVELVLYAFTEFRWGTLLLIAIGTPLASDLVERVLVTAAAPLGGPERIALSALTPDEFLALSIVGGPLWLAGAWALGAVFALNTYYGFVLGRRGDDLVYERGLLSEYSGSIPEEKVQTLTVTENPLHRVLGYASLSIDTAGYAGQQAQQMGDRSAVPLAERDRVRALARNVGGVDFAVAFERPPKRARRRYLVRYSLALLGLLGITFAVSRIRGGFSLWWTPAILVLLGPLAAHYQWKHRGYAVLDDHLLVRAGYWRRRTKVVPYHRLQTAVRTRTVFQRRLDLAHLVADTASSSALRGGGATAYDVPAEKAAELRERLRERLQESLHGDPMSSRTAVR